MTSEEIKELISRVNSMPKNISLYLTDEEYDICIQNGVELKKIRKITQGTGGHRFSGGKIGIYICRKGYYKIIAVKNNYQVPDGRIFDEALITYYNKTNASNFLEEEVAINAGPLHNRTSIGPMVQFKKGMILNIKEETTVVNNSYRIVWEILK